MTDNIPKNLPTERAVIGSCLLLSEAIGIVSEKLRPEDFYGQSNKMAYEICVDMYQSGKPVDLTTFQSEADRIILEALSEKETSEPVSIGTAMPSVLLKMEELRTGARKNAGYMSKLTDLDRILGGFQPGTLNIITARPSMGKTALALNIAKFGSSAETNSHVLFFSLEMSCEQLIHRMLSAQTLELCEGVEIS